VVAVQLIEIDEPIGRVPVGLSRLIRLNRRDCKRYARVLGEPTALALSPTRDPRRVGHVGYDLVAVAPRSVGLAHSAHRREDPDVAQMITDVHEMALAAALAALECRIGRLLARVTEHRWDTAPQPLLHAHVVFGPPVERDGRAQPVDVADLAAGWPSAALVYRRVLEEELARQLHARWGPEDARGVREIVQVPAGVLRQWGRPARPLVEIGRCG